MTVHGCSKNRYILILNIFILPINNFLGLRSSFYNTLFIYTKITGTQNPACGHLHNSTFSYPAKTVLFGVPPQLILLYILINTLLRIIFREHS